MDTTLTSHVQRATLLLQHQSVLIVEMEQAFHEWEQTSMEHVAMLHDLLEATHNVELEMILLMHHVEYLLQEIKCNVISKHLMEE
jgi:hypothetical protein